MPTQILPDPDLFSFTTEDLPQVLDELEPMFLEIIKIVKNYPVNLARFLEATFVESIRNDWRTYQGRNGRELVQLISSMEVLEEPGQHSATIITADVPMLNVYWRRVLSDIGSNCSAPLWRSPMILVANLGARRWPNVNELEYVSRDVNRRRNLVQLGLQHCHPYFERDMDPWRLQTSAPPVDQAASYHEKRDSWKRLPRPKELSKDLHLPELVDRLRGRFNYTKADSYFYYVPPHWDPISIPWQAWRDGKSFPEKTVLYKRRRGMEGYLDRGGRIWVWHDEKSHWDVQFDDGDSHINVSYTGKNLSI
jgi:hypothetical protein